MLDSSKWGRKWIVCLKTWDKGRKEVLFSEIFMLDTCLCVEVIHFQIGIKFFLYSFYSTWKIYKSHFHYNWAFSKLMWSLGQFPRADLHFRISKVCLSTHVLCVPVSFLDSIMRLVHWLDWTSVIARSRKYFKFLKNGDQKRNHFTCLLAFLDS